MHKRDTDLLAICLKLLELSTSKNQFDNKKSKSINKTLTVLFADDCIWINNPIINLHRDTMINLNTIIFLQTLKHQLAQ